ncbi:hypothetical protein FVR03_01170 [Pontibacter qinzhouensis]|uniref:Uncharacterized protein n=1 Tax=Pontibacter qinzhouensis TaxID=2603253 RepID=A0A5C8KAZ2_9BACT|nr:hypothetical protein [Pontibacter qinzhouensis]TXK52354.1 hypothetical protein FVR03_01170 [Pontibacter qinzhouensis]
MKKQTTYENLFGEVITVSNKKGNPLLKSFGKGPEGERCKNCKHIYRKQYAGTYYKCELRGNTNGPGTDHRVNWPACGKFEKGED